MIIAGCVIIATSLCLSGCVPEEQHAELMKCVAQYNMNTIPTVVHYTGSDETHDYFYIDVPFGRNRACKVKKPDTLVVKRSPGPRGKSRGRLYNPILGAGITNLVMLKEGTNIVLTTESDVTEIGIADHDSDTHR